MPLLLLAKSAHPSQGLVLEFVCYLNDQMDAGRRVGTQTLGSKILGLANVGIGDT